MPASETEARSYLEHLQVPPGWFHLVQSMTAMMTEVADDGTDLAFLEEAGSRVAARCAVQARRLGELNRAVNQQLERFRWGYAEFFDEGHCIRIVHHCLPAALDGKEAEPWLRAFSAILTGLYDAWFRQTGMPAALSVRAEKMLTPDALQLRLQRY